MITLVLSRDALSHLSDKPTIRPCGPECNPISLVDYLYQGPKGVRSRIDKMPEESNIRISVNVPARAVCSVNSLAVSNDGVSPANFSLRLIRTTRRIY